MTTLVLNRCLTCDAAFQDDGPRPDTCINHLAPLDCGYNATLIDQGKTLEEAVLIMPKNTITRIDTVWCFVSVDPSDNTEGVLSAPLMGPGSQVPLIAADEKRLALLEPIARDIAHFSKMRVRLIRLTNREEIREFGP